MLSDYDAHSAICKYKQTTQREGEKAQQRQWIGSRGGGRRGGGRVISGWTRQNTPGPIFHLLYCFRSRPPHHHNPRRRHRGVLWKRLRENSSILSFIYISKRTHDKEPTSSILQQQKLRGLQNGMISSFSSDLSPSFMRELISYLEIS